MQNCTTKEALVSMIRLQYGPFKPADVSPDADMFELCNKIMKAYWSVIDSHSRLSDQVQREGPAAFFRFFFLNMRRDFGSNCPNENRAVTIYQEYTHRLNQIPVFGAILLNYNLTKTLLVGFEENSELTFSPPRGKRDELESPVDTAVREVREETGLDITHLISPNEYIQTKRPNGKVMTLFIVVTPLTGRETFPISAKSTLTMTQRNGEVDELRWVDLHDTLLIRNIENKLTKQQRAISTFSEELFTLLFAWAHFKMRNPRSNLCDNEKIFLHPVRRMVNNDEVLLKSANRDVETLSTVLRDHVASLAGHLSLLFPPIPQPMLLQTSFISYTHPDDDCNNTYNNDSRYYSHNNDHYHNSSGGVLRNVLITPQKHSRHRSQDRSNNYHINVKSHRNDSSDSDDGISNSTRKSYTNIQNSRTNGTIEHEVISPDALFNAHISVDDLFQETSPSVPNPSLPPRAPTPPLVSPIETSPQSDQVDVDALFTPTPTPTPRNTTIPVVKPSVALRPPKPVVSTVASPSSQDPLLSPPQPQIQPPPSSQAQQAILQLQFEKYQQQMKLQQSNYNIFASSYSSPSSPNPIAFNANINQPTFAQPQLAPSLSTTSRTSTNSNTPTPTSEGGMVMGNVTSTTATMASPLYNLAPSQPQNHMAFQNNKLAQLKAKALAIQPVAKAPQY